MSNTEASLFFPQTPSLKRIFMGVACAHVLFFAGMGLFKYSARQTPQRLVVQTVSLPQNSQAPRSTSPLRRVIQEEVKEIVSPPKPTVVPKETAEPKKKETPVKEVKKQAKKQEAAKPAETKPVKEKAKKEETKKEEVKKEEPLKKVEKNTPQIKKELLKELQKDLDEAKLLDQTPPASAPSLPSLRPLSGNLPTLSMATAPTQADYTTTLTQQLMQFLRLPDVGDVKISLTLTASGKVVSLEILKSASSANQRYVQQQLPSLTFPAWGVGSEEKNFLLTLRPRQD